ncbi:hypothetical protein Dimus_025682 [Dionaea muscipula]
MDFLIASYGGSSDEEEDHRQHHRGRPSQNTAIDAAAAADDDGLEDEDDPSPSESNLQTHVKPFSPSLALPQPQSSSSSSLFSSVPKPQSSTPSSFSFFSSLPPPKSSIPSPQIPLFGTLNSKLSTAHVDVKEEKAEKSNGHSSSVAKASAVFSSLPPPKSESDADAIPNSSSLKSGGKKVVHFRPPTTLYSSKKYDDDDDEEEQEERKKKPQVISQSTSVKSFLSSIPAPKNSSTLGVLPSSASGHRLVVEEEKPSLLSDANSSENVVGFDSNPVTGQCGIVDGSNPYSANWVPLDQNYAGFESYGSYENYVGHQKVEDYGNYQGSWDHGSSAGMISEPPLTVESFIKVSGKRGRDQAPTEIVEVKQDELMKDRPREDQVKLTGIAFGPAYQPTSTKMKPSKLHKRKHQIGSLYYDMKQKEMELTERRARGFLTKAETQAKYGW